MTSDDRYDAVVVGGSFAGLQAALTLGRACRRVLVVDAGEPRNARAAHVHNFFGQPGPTPGGLRATARQALREHAVELVEDTVVAARPEPGGIGGPGRPGWRLTGRGGGTWLARAVVLATGLREQLPDLPGVAELWGRDVVACPHCHGWEVRGAPLAQLGMRGRAAKGVDRATLLSRWSADVTFFTDGDQLTPQQGARLKAAGVEVVETPVRGLVHRDGCLERLELEDGRSFAPRAVFAVTVQSQQTDATALFGCTLAADGLAVAADADGSTGVPGVWAAGTAVVPALLAVGAAGHGAAVALAVHGELLERELDGEQRTIPVPDGAASATRAGT